METGLGDSAALVRSQAVLTSLQTRLLQLPPLLQGDRPAAVQLLKRVKSARVDISVALQTAQAKARR